MELTANIFTDGLIKDSNPITTPNNVLTDALNATLLTFNGNENVLQNDMGNTNLVYYPRTWEAIENENNGDIDYRETVSNKLEKVKLNDNFIPIGIKEHGNILYIVSYNPITKQTEIGSFPGPEYRPFDAIPKEQLNCSDIIINEKTLNKIYNLTDLGTDEFLRPYDLISDYELSGFAPYFINTKEERKLYIPKYINPKTGQDITNAIEFSFIYLKDLFNYKFSENKYKNLKDFFKNNKVTLHYQDIVIKQNNNDYDVQYDICNDDEQHDIIIENKKFKEIYLIKSRVKINQNSERQDDNFFFTKLKKLDYNNICNLNFDIVWEDLCCNEIYLSLNDVPFYFILTTINLSNTKLYSSGSSNILELQATKEECLNNEKYNPFISYPNVSKGDIGVKFDIENVDYISYYNESSEGDISNYIPLVEHEEILYNNLIISTAPPLMEEKYINKLYKDIEYNFGNTKLILKNDLNLNGNYLYDGLDNILELPINLYVDHDYTYLTKGEIVLKYYLCEWNFYLLDEYLCLKYVDFYGRDKDTDEYVLKDQYSVKNTSNNPNLLQLNTGYVNFQYDSYTKLFSIKLSCKEEDNIRYCKFQIYTTNREVTHSNMPGYSSYKETGIPYNNGTNDTSQNIPVVILEKNIKIKINGVEIQVPAILYREHYGDYNDDYAYNLMYPENGLGTI